MTQLESGQLSGDLLRSAEWPGMCCHDVLYAPRMRLETHWHERAIFALTLAGGYEERTGCRTTAHAPASVVFHRAGEEHAVAIGVAAARCFIVEVDSATIEQRFGCTPLSSIHHASCEASFLLATMYREFRTDDSATELSLQGLLLQLLATASRSDASNERPHRAILGPVEEFLRENFRSQFTLDEIAAAVGAAPARLSAIFRGVRGRSIAEEQRRMRIDYACRRMLDSRLSLAEIGLECGFADQPHFSRAFRSVTGMTPARYRALLR